MLHARAGGRSAVTSKLVCPMQRAALSATALWGCGIGSFLPLLLLLWLGAVSVLLSLTMTGGGAGDVCFVMAVLMPTIFAVQQNMNL